MHFSTTHRMLAVGGCDNSDVRARKSLLVSRHDLWLTPEEITPVVDAFRKRPAAWVDFMMRFELGLKKPEPARAAPFVLTRRRLSTHARPLTSHRRLDLIADDAHT